MKPNMPDYGLSAGQLARVFGLPAPGRVTYRATGKDIADLSNLAKPRPKYDEVELTRELDQLMARYGFTTLTVERKP